MMRIRHSRAHISADFPAALRYLSRPARARPAAVPSRARSARGRCGAPGHVPMRRS
ncbi:hypothetical protein BDI4_680024 [Burkholderia diffusa]|nr:hypothetical protein BDI4_680024 [Burkholderia diffusa]